jgi:K(+)-stimulated pyrophosphate-energized sodium pump
MAEQLNQRGYGGWTRILSLVCFLISTVFVYRSFYGMRIGHDAGEGKKPEAVASTPEPAADSAS